MFLRSACVLPRFSATVPFFRRIRFTKMSAQAGPLCPKFIPVEQTGITSTSSAEGYKFSVVSYNILAQVYVKSVFFPHSPPPCLKWKARSQAVLALLKSLKADFFCLQEVDEHDSFYKGNMEQNGYSSIYIQRTGQKRDGCGVFYKNNIAELVLQENIEYNDLVNSINSQSVLSDDENDASLAKEGTNAEKSNGSSPGSAKEDRGDPNDPRVRLKRDCVGIIAAFRLKDPSHHIVIVANTHLYWDPEWADVKLAQAKYLVSRLALFKTLVSERFDCTPSIILAGDFNSTPGDQVYQYLVSGSPSSMPPVECSDDLPIPLCSVYACTRGEPTFTNCTPSFTDTLDYLFFSPSGCIKPVSFLELPEADSSSVAGGLPNYQHPSDHLPIGAEFVVIREN
ncbi:Carbon catabolite repressor protein 4 4 [Ancistrocladus abbreviatus]